MQTTYASTNKGYVTTINDLKAQMSAFASSTTANVRTQYNAAVASYNSSSDGTTSLVGSLISRYNDLITTRQNAQAAAMALVNAAVATAEGVNNNATSDSSAYAATAGRAANQRMAAAAAANKILTDAIASTNAAVAQGTATNTASAKTITDLAAEINRKLTSTAVSGIMSASKTLETSVTGMLADLDDSFFSLENSVQRLRTIINNDFSAHSEVTVRV
jgi:cell division septum initiation protein DivIVA